MYLSKGMMYSYLHHIKQALAYYTKVRIYKGEIPFTDEQLSTIGYSATNGGPLTNSANLIATIVIPQSSFQLSYIAPENWRITMKSTYVGTTTGEGTATYANLCYGDYTYHTTCVSTGDTEAAVLRLNKTSFAIGDAISINSFNFNIQRKTK